MPLPRFVAAIGLTAAVACGPMEESSRERPGDGATIYQSTILTMDRRRPSAEAVIVKGGIIVDVGAIDDIVQAYPGAAFDERFLRRTLMPAFVDVRVRANSPEVIEIPCQGALLAEELVAAARNGAPVRVVALGQVALSAAIEAVRRVPAGAPIGRMSVEVRGPIDSQAARSLSEAGVPLILSGDPVPENCDPPPSAEEGVDREPLISGVIALAPPSAAGQFLVYAGEFVRSGGSVRLSPQDALEAITTDAAYALGDEAVRGLIAPGRRADFAVLDGNPLARPGEAWGAIRIEPFVAAP